MEASAIRWLIQHVPAEFWLQFKELLDIINLTHREQLVVINKRRCLSAKKSFGNHLSYDGGRARAYRGGGGVTTIKYTCVDGPKRAILR